ncbi:MAG: PAS domain-containing protein [Deltaproteobacteria bacterium]|nr:PAS domain-containing protein [Deltaproteobacteria bacterium]
MSFRLSAKKPYGLQTSPWIVLGSTAILLVVVLVLAIANTNREKRYMAQVLKTKGAALIQAVEAGARTGMAGMMWRGQEVQRLLEETARLPDVIFMAVVDRNGRVVAHSDQTRIGAPFRQGEPLRHLGPDQVENWELVERAAGQRIFEVHRHFQPLDDAGRPGEGHMAAMMQRHGRMASQKNDWFQPHKRQELIIVAGLDVSPFEEAIRGDILNTVVLSAVLIVMGFGGLVSLSWMQNYRVAQKNLQDTTAYADEIVTHLPVGLIATDPSGKIAFSNAAAERITGLDLTVLRGKSADECLFGNLCGLQEALERGGTILEEEMTCQTPAGGEIPVSVSAVRIVNAVGDYVGQVLIIRDLGEVRRLQDEVRRQEKLAAIGGLAAGVAHEIRNPLSSIKALATFFSGQFASGSEGREAAEVMAQEVDRLNRAITELLEFARPTDLKPQSTDMRFLIERSLQLVRQDAADRDIHIDMHIDDHLCPVWIDPDRFSQCLLNLYLNAIQAMDKGGTLAVRCRSDRGRQLEIAVSDTGQGIAPEDRQQIFNPYYTTKPKGTGLGLAIVHKIVEAHEGRLQVDSTPRRGSCFTLRLPCRSQEEPS